MRGKGRLAIAAWAILLASPALAQQGIYSLEIDDDVATAEIALGSISATLTLRFENVVGLTPENLGLSVSLADPLMFILQGRLKPNISLPAAFPLVVKISPPQSGGLSFSGVVSVELYTHDLLYTIGSPFRLYSARDGGEFSDITNLVTSGSIRSGGSKADFSEFIIALDLRSPRSVVNQKYSRLLGLLNKHAAEIDGTIHAELVSLFTASKNAHDAGNLVSAIGFLEAFNDRVVAGSGNGIPDVWRSSRDLTNVAGLLRSSAGTLRYSLTLASNAL